MSDVDEYNQALTDLEHNLKAGIRAFAQWFAREWQMDAKAWARDFDAPVPSDDWFNGHNTGVESALLAVDTFLNDHP